MLTIVLVVHILVTVALIGLVLIQRGKGADIGAAFGSGASQTVFGSQGSASFLTRTTAVLATVFFVTSLTLAYLYAQKGERRSVTDLPVEETVPQPVESAPDVPPDLPPVPLDVPQVPMDHEPATGDGAAGGSGAQGGAS